MWFGLIFTVAFHVGCSAEQLAVIQPPVGVESIDAEDLQRDVWALLKPTSQLSREEWLRLRFEQHGAVLESLDGGHFCARQSAPVHNFTATLSKSSNHPYWSAILLSLAKGLEHNSSGSFCLTKLSSDPSTINLKTEFPNEPWAEDDSPEEKFSKINYQLLSQNVQALLRRLE